MSNIYFYNISKKSSAFMALAEVPLFFKLEVCGILEKLMRKVNGVLLPEPEQVINLYFEAHFPFISKLS